jgi:SAM-dependent methyltransferase
MTPGPPVLADEVELLEALVPLEGARLLELGCGDARFARRLLERAAVATIAALETDAVQHERNLASAHDSRLAFLLGGAQEIPLDEASFDGVLMMKSLHHVPAASLDRALAEVRRVLRPGGWLYVSEPLYAGAFNDILRLFHDEGAARAAAREALGRAARSGVLEAVAVRHFLAPREFRDYDEFVEKVVHVTHTLHAYSDEVAAQVRAKLEALGPGPARFLQPMRVDLLRRPAAGPERIRVH